MKSKLLMLVAILFLLSIFSVSASEINVTTVEAENQISVNEIASFKLQILNKDRQDHDFFITTPYSEAWRIVAEPYIVNIPSKYIGTTKIDVYPLKLVNTGDYDLFIDIKSRDKSIEVKYPLQVRVIQTKGDGVKIELIKPWNIDTRTGMSLKLKLENLYRYDLNDLKVEIKSDIFYKKQFIDLKARESKIEEFNIGFEKEVKAGDYNINVEISKNDEILGGVSEQITVNEYFEVTEKTGKEKGFLVNKVILKRENKGSNVSEEKIEYFLGNLQRTFSSFNFEPDETEKVKHGYNLKWTFTLQPGEVKEVIIETNYSMLFFGIIAIIIIGFVLYYYGGKKIFVYKTIRKVGKHEEGINYIKIALHVKNKTGKALSDIKIVDYLPKLVTAVKKDFGTMKPSKVQVSRSTGTMRLVWELEGLDKGEERVITYAVRSKMSIIGKVILPNAVVEYKGKKGFVKVKSNKLSILTSERKG